MNNENNTTEGSEEQEKKGTIGSSGITWLDLVLLVTVVGFITLALLQLLGDNIRGRYSSVYWRNGLNGYLCAGFHRKTMAGDP